MNDPSRLDLRPVTETEWPAFVRAIAGNFGEDPSDASIERFREVAEFDRFFGAFEPDGRIAANGGAFSFDLSLPGGREAPCAGITIIGVRSDWRRRGLLNRLMRVLFDQARERGEPFAGLWASESAIYGRYGFGVVSEHVRVVAPTATAALRTAADVSEVALIEADTALEAVPGIYAAHRRGRPGMMARRERFWSGWLGHDDEDERNGASSRYHALLPGRGYAIYRIKPAWDGYATGQLIVEELVANDAHAVGSLWRFLLDVDLVETVKAERRPADEPLPLLFVQHDRLDVRRDEPHWLRLLDVPIALEARGYEVDGRLVVDVRDEVEPRNAGRWRLDVRDGRATCDAVEGGGDDYVDLRLDVADLASICLGGVTATRLAGAGLIEEVAAGAAGRADRLFHTAAAPWQPFIY